MKILLMDRSYTVIEDTSHDDPYSVFKMNGIDLAFAIMKDNGELICGGNMKYLGNDHFTNEELETMIKNKLVEDLGITK